MCPLKKFEKFIYMFRFERFVEMCNFQKFLSNLILKAQALLKLDSFSVDSFFNIFVNHQTCCNCWLRLKIERTSLANRSASKNGNKAKRQVSVGSENHDLIGIAFSAKYFQRFLISETNEYILQQNNLLPRTVHQFSSKIFFSYRLYWITIAYSLHISKKL